MSNNFVPWTTYFGVDDSLRQKINLADNDSNFSWRKVKKYMDSEGSDLTRKQIEPLLIAYMNKFFGVLPFASQSSSCLMVVRKGKNINIVNDKSFQQMLQPYGIYYQQGGKNKRMKYESLSRFYLNSEHRQQYSKIVFDPSGKNHAKDVLNCYIGLRWSHSECKAAWKSKNSRRKCRIFLEHLRRVFCNDNYEIYNYFLKWIGIKLSKPWQKLHTSILVVGPEGSGKGITLSFIMELFKPYAVKINDINTLTSKFNDILKDRLFLFVDELYVKSNQTHIMSKLKNLITEETFVIEEKFRKPFQTNNYFNIVMASNQYSVVKTLIGIRESKISRRYVAWEISGMFSSQRGKKARDYWKELVNTMYSDDMQCLKAFQYYITRKINLEGFGLGQDRPYSQLMMSISAKDIFKSYIETSLKRGYHTKQVNSNIQWYTQVPLASMYDSYIEYANVALQWAKSRRIVRLCEFVGKLKEVFSDQVGIKDSIIVLPDLNNCKQLFFLKYYGNMMNIPNEKVKANKKHKKSVEFEFKNGVFSPITNDLMDEVNDYDLDNILNYESMEGNSIFTEESLMLPELDQSIDPNVINTFE